MNEIKGKVYSPLAIDKTLTQEYMCADAKATGDAIKKVGEDSKARFSTYFQLGANVQAQGSCHYVEGNGFAVGHLLVRTGAEIPAGQILATMPSLKGNMVKTINVAYISADVIAYPFDFEGKSISSRSTIPSGKTLQMDFCIGLE